MFTGLRLGIVHLDDEMRPRIIAYSIEKRIDDSQRILPLRVAIGFEARHENDGVVRQAEPFPVVLDTLRQLKR